MAITSGSNLRIIASFDDYSNAQRAVDRLSDEGFPVEQLRIVGEGLHTVEQVTGRKGYGRAAGEGAGSGAVLGAILGTLFGLLTLFEPLTSAITLAFWGAIFGAVIGAVFGLIAHATTRGERDFSSVSTVTAARYNLIADSERADEAERRLAELGLAA